MDVTIRPPHVLFNTNDKHRAITIATFDKRFMAFKMPFEPRALRELKRVFPEAKITSGQPYVDDLKRRLSAQNYAKQNLGTYKGNRIDGLPYPPKAHQWEGADYLELFEEGALFADCGTGKTYTTLLDILNKYRLNLISNSSVLVIGKLMTLHTVWADDALKFTNLTSTVLWEPSRAIIEKGEIEHATDHGPKQNTLPEKIRTKTEYFYKTGAPAIISGPRFYNPKLHVAKKRKYRESGGVKFGKETLVPITRRNMGAESVREKIRSKNTHIHIINHEGLTRFKRELTERNYEYIVLDESTVIKNNQSSTFKSLMEISRRTKYKRILTGTPMPQGPQDIWSQFYFLDKGLTFGASFAQWMSNNFNYIDIGSKAKGTFVGRRPVLRASRPGVEGTLAYVDRMLTNRVYKKRLRDCTDIPDEVESVLYVYLTPELQRHYTQMEEMLMVEMGDQVIEVGTELAKLGKLRQITGGFILNREKDVIRLSDPNPKLNALMSYIEEIDVSEKILIFAMFRCEIEMLLSIFGSAARSIYGGSKDDFAQGDFINDPSVRYLICQPQSAAHGINGLTVSKHLIFYSIDYRADMDYQAKRRLVRTGQTRGVIIKYLLAKGTIDERIYKVVNLKQAVQNETIFKEEV